MKDSGVEWIGDIPEDWKVSKVKDGFYRKKQKAHKDNPTILSLTSTGIKIRDISTNEGQIAVSYYEYNPVEVGDLLLNPMDLVTNAFSSVSNIEGVISPAYVNLKNKEGYFSKYYDYYFKLQYWGKSFFAHGKGVSFENRWTLNNQTLMNYPIPHPVFSEQQAIVDYLDRKCQIIDSTIQKQKVVIEKLKLYKQSIITEVVTKGLDPNTKRKTSGVDWIGEIPEKWKVCKIKNIGVTSSGSTPLRYKNEEYYNNANIKWVRTLDLNDDIVDDTQEKITEYALNQSSCKMLPIDTVMIAMYGGAGTIGKCGILSCEATTNQAICSIICNNRIEPYYLLDLFRIMKPFWMKYAVGTRVDPNISQDIVANMIIPLPTIDEQQLIVNYLKQECYKINKVIDSNLKLIDKLDQYKKSLIYECVTGKREVI